MVEYKCCIAAANGQQLTAEQLHPPDKYIVKKRLAIPGNSPWQEIIKLFPAREFD
jgi:hypothetical protein